ncbi:MAG: flippase activity-associated protein Agl23 [Planctomycetota bacterium]|jgi:uncharacterized protein (TIGR03663 family)
MKRRVVFGLGIAAVVIAAAGMRLCDLGRRPMHTDEAVQAEKARLLVEENAWRYDPHEYHGPTLPYASAPLLLVGAGGRIENATEVTLRLVPALFGVGIVLLTLLVAGGLGRPGALVAAVLAAASPAMVFYSRYFIHETLLVFFTFGALATGWRYLKCRLAGEAEGGTGLGWALGCGAFLGLVHATKGTCAFTFVAIVSGLATAWGAHRWIDGKRVDLPGRIGWKHPACAAGVALAVSFILYASFFANMRGPVDSVLTYFVSAERAVGPSVHGHPWHYYLKLLAWTKYGRYPSYTEGLIIALAVVGGAAAFVRRGAFLQGTGGADGDAGGETAKAAAPSRLAWIADSVGARDGTDVHLARFLAGYTLALVVIYSAVPYKTPWCALSFLHGMVLLAGIGAVALVRAMPRAALRIAVASVLAAGTVHLAWQSHRWNFRFAAARFNPFNYAPTSSDLLNLVRLVEKISALSPRGREVHIRVIAPESWPLPWYFRPYANVDYWPELPAKPDAAVVIAAADAPADVKARLATGYVAGYYGLRPGVTLTLHVRKDLWAEFLERAPSGGPGAVGPDE